MNGDQIQGSLRQLVLTIAASDAGSAILSKAHIVPNDLAAFVGVLFCGAAYVWQLAHHKETGGT